MARSSAPKSLQRTFHRMAVKWSLAGFGLTLLFAVPCVLYSAKVASERQVLTVAKAAARAFRPQILEGDVRGAEFQMRHALELAPGESAIVRDPQFTAIYPLERGDEVPKCTTPDRACWGHSLRSVSYLFPIYFDSDSKTGLFGYLEVSIKPTIDWTAISILVSLLVIAFFGQAFGLSSALSQSATVMLEQLSAWAEHLKRNPGVAPRQMAAAPYSELYPMQDAIEGLHVEIERLQDNAAKEAKAVAQLALLREIGHDLRTPHSQLAKQFALHLDTLRSTGQADPAEVSRIERTLRRMGELIRQVRVFQDVGPRGDVVEACSLTTETRTILEDLKQDSEITSKGVEVELTASRPIADGRISKVGFYRILDNLLRNAIQAAPPKGGKITVDLNERSGRPVLSVRCGV